MHFFSRGASFRIYILIRMRNSCGSFSICPRGSREHVVVLAIGLLFLQRQGILPTTMAGLDEGCGR